MLMIWGRLNWRPPLDNAMEKIYLQGHMAEQAALAHPFYALRFGMNEIPVRVQKDEYGFFVLGNKKAKKALAPKIGAAKAAEESSVNTSKRKR